MFLRTLGISIVKWIAVFFAVTVFTSYVAPKSLHGYWLALPIWVMVFAIAYGFAYWVFHIKIPSRRDLLLLIAIWMVVTICLEAFYEVMTIGQPVFLLYSPDIYVQYLLEIIAILVCAQRIRKEKMKSVSGEGLVA
jgi:hypothetical protein